LHPPVTEESEPQISPGARGSQKIPLIVHLGCFLRPVGPEENVEGSVQFERQIASRQHSAVFAFGKVKSPPGLTDLQSVLLRPEKRAGNEKSSIISKLTISNAISRESTKMKL
jgi:hypothetical protein